MQVQSGGSRYQGYIKPIEGSSLRVVCQVDRSLHGEAFVGSSPAEMVLDLDP